jgi:hypothetical protein
VNNVYIQNISTEKEILNLVGNHRRKRLPICQLEEIIDLSIAREY